MDSSRFRLRPWGKPNLSFSERNILIIGVFMRLFCGAFLASHFLTDLFVPFLADFANDPSASPYNKALERGSENAFPYPAGMLYFLSFFFMPAYAVAPENIFISILSVRVGLLVAELIAFFTMRDWLPNASRRRFTIFFWLNPITFYISYVYGQFDVVAISFLILSMGCLFKGRVKQSAAIYAIALATKTSVLLILPVYALFFMQRRFSAQESLQFILIVIMCFLALNTQFIMDYSFMEMVFNNKEQAKMLSFKTDIAELTVYWIFIFLLSLFAMGYKIGISNHNLFLMFCAFYFSAVLLVLPPMNGWYWWVVPFFAYFFSISASAPLHLLMSLHLLYFAFFLVTPYSDLNSVTQLIYKVDWTFYSWAKESAGLPAQLIVDSIYTLMQGVLFLLCVQVLYSGLLRYRIQKLSGRPFLIGIGGDSGVGKTTLAQHIEEIFGAQNTTVLRGDDKHKWQRGAEEWRSYTHLNPKANYLHDEIYTLRQLKKGKKVWRPTYDHSTGLFTQPMPIVPNRLMMLEGLHPFYLSNQREIYDLRVFIAPEEQLAVHWKILRDQEKRGHSRDAILNQIDSRRQDFIAFITAQAVYADIVISPKPDRPIDELGSPDAVFDILYEVKFKNSYSLDVELRALEHVSGLEVSHRYEGIDHQVVMFSGVPDDEQIATLFEGLCDDLQQAMVGADYAPTGLLGAVLFTITKLILKEANHD